MPGHWGSTPCCCQSWTDWRYPDLAIAVTPIDQTQAPRQYQARAHVSVFVEWSLRVIRPLADLGPPRQGQARGRTYGMGVSRTFCAFMSREFYWTSTAAVYIMSICLSWRPSGAAAMAKPRDTLSVRLCFMGVSNCARFRPFRLSGLVGRVCKATRESRRRLLPASSRACVLIDVKMNDRSEPLNIKRSSRGFQPWSQISQCERPGRAASVPGIN